METHTHFADWHPHFTPRWLSERLASHLPPSFEGSVVDPACGAGNLLAAAAIRTRGAGRPGQALNVEFIGIDVSQRAVRECSSALAALLPRGSFRVDKADFLKLTRAIKCQDSAAVVMNPPFQGYGAQTDELRRRVVRLFQMKGRFNLSYAFVRHAVELFRPKLLVTLLPSTWVHSRACGFKAELERLGGTWDWEDVEGRAFRGISTHVGILVWRPRRRRMQKRAEHAGRKLGDVPGVVVHNGVATGRDAVFIELADSALPFGSRMTAVRGRDVGRATETQIWVPPAEMSQTLGVSVRSLVSAQQLDALEARSCVKRKGRCPLQYHDAIPDWFRTGPKLLIPEIATGSVRVELDTVGTRMPLHSVIAIRVPSVAVGRMLKRHLLRPPQQRALMSSGPRLVGGAVRMQVSALAQLKVPQALCGNLRRTRGQRGRPRR